VDEESRGTQGLGSKGRGKKRKIVGNFRRTKTRDRANESRGPKVTPTNETTPGRKKERGRRTFKKKKDGHVHERKIQRFKNFCHHRERAKIRAEKKLEAGKG